MSNILISYALSFISWCLIITHGESELQLDCYFVEQTKDGQTLWSGTGDDNYRRAECAVGYIRVGCGVRTRQHADPDVDGAIPTQVTAQGDCQAYNGHGGGGVSAVARCCKIVSTHDVALACDYNIQSDWGQQNSVQVIGCNNPSTQTITDCTIHSKWKNLAAVFGPTDWSMTNLNDKCVGHTYGTKKKTAAICCSLTGSDANSYELECQNWESPFCPPEHGYDDHSMFGCYAENKDDLNVNQLRQYYISDESPPQCVVTGGVRARARCCRVIERSSAHTVPSKILSVANYYANIYENNGTYYNFKIIMFYAFISVFIICFCGIMIRKIIRKIIANNNAKYSKVNQTAVSDYDTTQEDVILINQ